MVNESTVTKTTKPKYSKPHGIQVTMELGFCVSPRTKEIYVSRKYPDCLWYFYDFDADIHIPIEHDAIKGILTKVEIKDYVYKGDDKPKLKAHMDCGDRVLVLVMGLDTIISKGFLNSVDNLDVQKPFIFEPVAGTKEEKVLFSHVCQNGESVYIQKEALKEVPIVLASVMSKLGQTTSSPATIPNPKSAASPIAPPKTDSSKFPISQAQRTELAKIAESSQWEQKAIVAYLKSLGYDHSSQIPAGAFASVCDGLRDRDVWESFHQAVYNELHLGDWEQPS